MDLSSSLVRKLACPYCLAPLSEDDTGSRLACVSCGAQFPVQDGIPILKPATRAQECATVDYAHIPGESSRLPEGSARQALRGALEWCVSVQRHFVPVTPLHPLYHLRKFANIVDTVPHPRAILDAGGGNSPYRKQVAAASDEYVVLDVDASIIRPDDDRLSVIGDIHTLPFLDEQFDLVLLLEVLEHLYDPVQAVKHLARSLKPGGLLILTVPQYWHVHGWPSDYYRYTNFGLKYLCERHNLRIEKMASKGGPFLLLYSVLKLNFLTFAALPILRVLVDVPIVSFFWAMDGLFFSSNRERKHPDTAGWALVARKTDDAAD